MNLPKPVKLVNLPNLVNLDQTSNFPPSSSSFSSSSSSVWPRVAVRWYQQVNATFTQGTYRKLHCSSMLHTSSHFSTKPPHRGHTANCSTPHCSTLQLHNVPHCITFHHTGDIPQTAQGCTAPQCFTFLHTASHFSTLQSTSLHIASDFSTLLH